MRIRFYLLALAAVVGLPQLTQAADYAAVNLRIQAGEEIIYNSEVYVSSDGCQVTDSAGVEHDINGAKAICALTGVGQVGVFEYSVDYFDGVGLFLNSINDYVTPTDYSEYWSFFVNYAGAEVGLADYTVSNGDEVLLSFGPYAPDALRVKIPDNEMIVGAPVFVRVQSVVDAAKQIFAPVSGATVHFDDGNEAVTVTTDKHGKARFMPTATSTSVTFYATKTGAVRSETGLITRYEHNQEAKPLDSAAQVAMAQAGIVLLKSDIDDAGLILGNQSLTEWAAMSLAAGDESANRLAEAVVAYEPKVSDGTNEIARHILALVALGYDPRNVNEIDYVARLKDTQSGKQFGSEAFVNDDIFSGLALLAAGEAGDAAEVKVALQAAKAGINKDGGVAFAVENNVSDVDTTAFFVQFVSAAQAQGNTMPIKGAHQAAIHYVLQQQNLDGGFGYSDFQPSNSSSTAVVVQALHSIGRNPGQVLRNKRSAYNYLASIQKDSGQFAYSVNVSSNYDVLNTAYAIIGLFHKSLPVLQ